VRVSYLYNGSNFQLSSARGSRRRHGAYRAVRSGPRRCRRAGASGNGLFAVPDEPSVPQCNVMFKQLGCWLIGPCGFRPLDSTLRLAQVKLWATLLSGYRSYAIVVPEDAEFSTLAQVSCLRWSLHKYSGEYRLLRWEYLTLSWLCRAYLQAVAEQRATQTVAPAAPGLSSGQPASSLPFRCVHLEVAGRPKLFHSQTRWPAAASRQFSCSTHLGTTPVWC